MPKVHKCDVSTLSEIIESLNVGIIYIDENEKLAYINKEAEKIRNLMSEKDIGENVLEYHSVKVQNRVQEVINEFKRGEMNLRHRVIRVKGRCFENTYNIVKDENDKYKGVALVSSDVTEKIELQKKIIDSKKSLERTVQERTKEISEAYQQLKVAQEHMVQTEKMNALGKFVSGLAHEINNPLDGIQNCIRAVLSEPEDKEQLENYLSLSLDGLYKIELLVRQLLDYARPHAKEKSVINVNKLLDEVLTLVRIKCRDKKIKVIKEISEEELLVNGNPHYLEQVFMNLILNAIEAMEMNGTLTIESKYDEDGEVSISIKDTGSGIDQKHLKKIFDPFFTTKLKSEGTGLGLYLSYNSVKEHGGKIEVNSELGNGTEFLITIPASQVSQKSKKVEASI